MSSNHFSLFLLSCKFSWQHTDDTKHVIENMLTPSNKWLKTCWSHQTCDLEKLLPFYSITICLLVFVKTSCFFHDLKYHCTKKLSYYKKTRFLIVFNYIFKFIIIRKKHPSSLLSCSYSSIIWVFYPCQYETLKTSLLKKITWKKKLRGKSEIKIIYEKKTKIKAFLYFPPFNSYQSIFTIVDMIFKILIAFLLVSIK